MGCRMRRSRRFSAAFPPGGSAAARISAQPRSISPAARPPTSPDRRSTSTAAWRCSDGSLRRGLAPLARSRGKRLGQAPTNKGKGTFMSETADRVKKIVVEHLGVEAEKVTEEASFIDDLGADSLDIVELVMAFEEEFGVEIPDDAAEKITTVKDAIDYIENNKA